MSWTLLLCPSKVFFEVQSIHWLNYSLEKNSSVVRTISCVGNVSLTVRCNLYRLLRDNSHGSWSFQSSCIVSRTFWWGKHTYCIVAVPTHKAQGSGWHSCNSSHLVPAFGGDIVAATDCGFLTGTKVCAYGEQRRWKRDRDKVKSSFLPNEKITDFT